LAPEGAAAGATREPRGTLAPALVAIAVFVFVASPLLRAPLFNEDTLFVSRLREEGIAGALADFGRPQYGLSSVRFYRPLVSLSLALQSAISVDPTWLRSANLLAYLVGIVAVVHLARRLGAGRLGAAFAGSWAALFPGGPGDWCWVVGRVDAFSFGFGLLGLALLPGRESARPWVRSAWSAVALAAAFLSKETAIAFPVAAFAVGFVLEGRRGLLHAIPPALAVAAVFAMRQIALEGIVGGYVGAGPPEMRLDVSARSVAVATGLQPEQALWAVLWVVALAAVASWRDADRRRAAAACGVGALALGVPAALSLASAIDLAPILARVFPAAFALGGLVLALVLGADDLRRPFALALAIALLLVPATALSVTISGYHGASALVERDRATIEAARRKAGDARCLLAFGLPNAWPLTEPAVHVYNVGVAERFAPPFAPPGVAVWPLRLVDPSPNAEPVVISRSSELATHVVRATSWSAERGITWTDDVPALVRLAPGALPEVLDGPSVEALVRGETDPKLALPAAPEGSTLRATIFTPVGAGAARLEADGLTWKKLLFARMGSSMQIYTLPGYAVDLGARRFLVRFEWLDRDGRAIAESDLAEVKIAPSFADLVRRAEADPAFGIVR